MAAFIARLPIGVKIVGLVTIVLSLMLGAAGYSFIQSRRAKGAMTDLTKEIVPLMESFARIGGTASDERLHFERALRHYEAAGVGGERQRDPARMQADADRGRAEFKAFQERDAAIAMQLDRARAALAEGLAKSVRVEDAVEFARLQPMLDFLSTLRQDYAAHAARVIGEISGGDMSTFRLEEPALEREEDRFEEMLDRTINDLDAFASRQSARVGADAASLQVLSGENLSLAGVSFVLGVALAGLITRRLVRPIRHLTGSAQAVAGGNLDVVVAVSSTDEVGTLAGAFNEMLNGLKDREKVKATFSKYIDARVVRHLLEPGSADLAGDRRIMTVLFADIADFSGISERLTPQALVKLINAYLTEMASVIRAEEGVIDKFIGDAVMAYWGPPFVAEGEQALRACRAAMRCLDRLEAFQRQVPEIVGLRTGAPIIDIRVGVSTGPMVVGNIGSEDSRNFTIMGDAVNLGSRLEGVCKVYGVRCLVSDGTREAIGDAIEFREIDAIAVKGKDEAVRIYEPLGTAGSLTAERAGLRDRFEDGLGHYRGRQWDAAAEAFEHILALSPRDGASRTFLERIETLRAEPPDPGWDGVWRLKTK
jgi:class 3 adenylate cyclase